MRRWVGTDLVRRSVRDWTLVWARDRSGSIAILFALFAVPVASILAVSIDYARASNQRSRLETALGAAAQAASHHLGEDKSIIEGKVKAMLAANLPPDLAELPHETKIPKDRMSLEVTIETRVPTTMMGIVGVDHLKVSATGFARRPVPVGIIDVPVAELPSGGLGSGLGVRTVGGYRDGSTFSGSPPAISHQDAEQALRTLTQQLPPAVAADLERALRDLQSRQR